MSHWPHPSERGALLSNKVGGVAENLEKEKKEPSHYSKTSNHLDQPMKCHREEKENDHGQG